MYFLSYTNNCFQSTIIPLLKILVRFFNPYFELLFFKHIAKTRFYGRFNQYANQFSEVIFTVTAGLKNVEEEGGARRQQEECYYSQFFIYFSSFPSQVNATQTLQLFFQKRSVLIKLINALCLLSLTRDQTYQHLKLIKFVISNSHIPITHTVLNKIFPDSWWQPQKYVTRKMRNIKCLNLGTPQFVVASQFRSHPCAPFAIRVGTLMPAISRWPQSVDLRFHEIPGLADWPFLQTNFIMISIS